MQDGCTAIRSSQLPDGNGALQGCGEDFGRTKLESARFSKNSSQIIASYNKNEFRFDQIIDIVRNNAEILDVSTDEGDLEDIFLEVTNRQIFL